MTDFLSELIYVISEEFLSWLINNSRISKGIRILIISIPLIPLFALFTYLTFTSDALWEIILCGALALLWLTSWVLLVKKITISK